MSSLTRKAFAAAALSVVFGWAFLISSHGSSIGQASVDPCGSTISAIPSGLHCATVTAHQSDIVNLATTPFVLVPAPGSGLVIFPIAVRWKFAPSSHPYQEPDNGAAYMYWQNNLNAFSYVTWGQLNSPTDFNGFSFPGFSSTVAFYGAGAGPNTPNAAVDPADYTNVPLVMQVVNGDSMNRGPVLTISPDAAGTGYAVGDEVRISTEGVYPNGGLFTVATLSGSGVASLTITSAGTVGLGGTGLATVNVGNVSSATVTAAHGGVGYANGDTGNITGCGDGNANYQVTSSTGGVVSAVSIIAAQSGATYTTTSACTTTRGTGSGTGLELNVVAATGSGLTVTTTVQPGDGTVTITIWYTVAAA